MWNTTRLSEKNVCYELFIVSKMFEKKVLAHPKASVLA